MLTPYQYLMTASTAPDDELIDELCAWHDRMVAHVRRHGATSRACGCEDECPRLAARQLWTRARQAFGDAALQLTFLRQHAAADAHG
jgi:hypothetical protein